MSMIDGFQDQVFFTVVRIVIKNEIGDGASIGTGFILRHELSREKCCYFLVTNKHVIPNSVSPIDLVFHTSVDNKEPDLTNFRQVTLADYNGGYSAHPNSDIAVINLSKFSEEKGLFWRHINMELIPNFDDLELKAGNEVWFVGYPQNRFDTKHNLPLLRKGSISSHPRVDFNGKPEIVIDAQVFQGSSGSPVFSALGGSFKLIGIISETMIKNNQLQTVPTKDEQVVQEVIGLGIVIKSSVLRDFIVELGNELKKQNGIA